MSYSYKCYSDTKEIMRKYVNATEGSIIYSMGKTHLMALVKDAGALYKVGNLALINTEVFEKFLEQFHEPSRPMPKHVWGKVNREQSGIDILKDKSCKK